jgi:hypothetical protein
MNKKATFPVSGPPPETGPWLVVRFVGRLLKGKRFQSSLNLYQIYHNYRQSQAKKRKNFAKKLAKYFTKKRGSLPSTYIAVAYPKPSSPSFCRSPSP